jgi:hypothetical protein
VQGSGGVIDYLSYPTLVGHIRLNKNYLFISVYEGYYWYVFYSFN